MNRIRFETNVYKELNSTPNTHQVFNGQICQNMSIKKIKKIKVFGILIQFFCQKCANNRPLK